jgi:hypothetical protein
METANGVSGDLKSDDFVNKHQAQLRKKPSLFLRLAWIVEDFFGEINWKHVAFKITAFTYLGIMAWITWWVLPIEGHWPTFMFKQSDRVPITYQDPLK